MSERKYSVSEIDKMRAAVRDLFGFMVMINNAAVEDRLRTYMINGTDPDELVAAGMACQERGRVQWAEHQRIASLQLEAESAALGTERETTARNNA